MPFGIIILGVLAIIGGVLSLMWGLALSGLGGMGWLTGLLFSGNLQSWGGNAFSAGIWSLVVGTVQIITGFGLFARQRWAWLLTLVSTTLSLVTPLMALLGGNLWAVFGLIIPGAIFYYLLANDNVRRAFGRA